MEPLLPGPVGAGLNQGRYESKILEVGTDRKQVQVLWGVDISSLRNGGATATISQRATDAFPLQKGGADVTVLRSPKARQLIYKQ
jgi:hypothetical protein